MYNVCFSHSINDFGGTQKIFSCLGTLLTLYWLSVPRRGSNIRVVLSWEKKRIAEHFCPCSLPWNLHWNAGQAPLCCFYNDICLRLLHLEFLCLTGSTCYMDHWKKNCLLNYTEVVTKKWGFVTFSSKQIQNLSSLPLRIIFGRSGTCWRWKCLQKVFIHH